MRKIMATLVLICMSLIGCQGGGGVAANEGGSEPINSGEELQYKKAVVRCYKTGGTRVVKIMGKLRCY